MTEKRGDRNPSECLPRRLDEGIPKGEPILAGEVKIKPLAVQVRPPRFGKDQVAGEQTAVLTGVAPDFPFQAHNCLASPVTGEGGEWRAFFPESQAHCVIPQSSSEVWQGSFQGISRIS